MKTITSSALVGALALIGLSTAMPASAMPAGPVAPITANAASGVEQVRLHRVYRGHPHWGARRGWHRGWHRGYRRPGPIRRLLRHL